MSKKVKEVIALLEINGWRQVRVRGDHRIFKKIGAIRPIPIAGKLSDSMAEGTFRAIMREAGLD